MRKMWASHRKLLCFVNRNARILQFRLNLKLARSFCSGIGAQMNAWKTGKIEQIVCSASEYKGFREHETKYWTYESEITFDKNPLAYTKSQMQQVHLSGNSPLECAAEHNMSTETKRRCAALNSSPDLHEKQRTPTEHTSKMLSDESKHKMPQDEWTS